MGLKDACEGSLALACDCWLCGSLQTWSYPGELQDQSCCLGSNLVWGFTCSCCFSPYLGDKDCRLFAIRASLSSNHIMRPGLKPWPLLFMCTYPLLPLNSELTCGLEQQDACVLQRAASGQALYCCQKAKSLPHGGRKWDKCRGWQARWRWL